MHGLAWSAGSLGAATALYALAATASAFAAVVAYRRRRRATTALGIVLCLAGCTAWSGHSVALDVAATLGAPVWLRQALVLSVYPCVTVVVAGFVCVARAARDPGWRLRPREAGLLAVEPAVVLVMTVTDPWLHLMQVDSRATALDAAAWQPAPGFWVHTAYSYGLWLLTSVHLTRAVVAGGSLARRQLGTLLVSGLVPLAANVVTICGLAPVGSIDLTPLFFTLTALLNAWAVFRLGMLSLVPVARSLVFDEVGDVVVVLSPDGVVLDTNLAADRLLAGLVPGPSRSYAGLRLTDLDDGRGVTGDGEHRLVLPDGEVVLQVRDTPLRDSRGRLIARLLVGRDITALDRQRELLRSANALLQQQIVDNERLRADLAELAVRDELTGLHNRRHLVSCLGRDVAAARASGADVSVVLFDVDHFKNVNDTWGHHVGDEVLRATAALLARDADASWTVARLGGEEFVVVLPGVGPDDAVRHAERWRLASGSTVITLRPNEIGDDAEPGVRVTVSAGVAALSRTGGDVDALLRACDRALYAAKAAGRNRVVACPGSAGDPAPAPGRAAVRATSRAS